MFLGIIDVINQNMTIGSQTIPNNILPVSWNSDLCIRISAISDNHCRVRKGRSSAI